MQIRRIVLLPKLFYHLNWNKDCAEFECSFGYLKAFNQENQSRKRNCQALPSNFVTVRRFVELIVHKKHSMAHRVMRLGLIKEAVSGIAI